MKTVELARLRLVSQGVHEPQHDTPLQAVVAMLALQGQDLPGALWSVGLRTRRASEIEVREAFDRGEIVRSWPMRGTLHVMTPADLHWMLPLSNARLISSFAARHRDLGIDQADIIAATKAAASALSGGNRLGRKALFDVFEKAGQSTKGQRGAHLVFLLAHAGLICLGPFSGKEQDFVLLEGWAPREQFPQRDEALAKLALRYFTAHGPATVADFAWWTKLTLTDARAGTDAASEHLSTIDCDGVSYLASPAIAELAASAIPGNRTVHALPGFDEMILGYTDRTASLAQEHSELIVPGGNGMFRKTIVAGGRVVGVWTIAERSKAIQVTPEYFGAVGPSTQKALAAAITRYGQFRGKTAELRDPTRSETAPNNDE